MKFFENFYFKVLYLQKMCLIFVGSVHNFGKLTMTLLSEKVLISNRCIIGLMSNLIKKSWTDPCSHVMCDCGSCNKHHKIYVNIIRLCGQYYLWQTQFVESLQTSPWFKFAKKHTHFYLALYTYHYGILPQTNYTTFGLFSY